MVEHRFGVQDAAVPGGADRGNHDDVAEPGDAAGVGAAFAQGEDALGGDVEQDAPVDVVGQEPRRPGVTQVVSATVETSARICAAELPPPTTTTRCPLNGSGRR